MGSEVDEVLVHINAPCTRTHDLRAASLIGAIRDFRPVFVTKVSGYDDILFIEAQRASEAPLTSHSRDDDFSKVR
jgi:hypothetical protein